MARYNAMEEIFTEIEVLGKPALFHDMRIDRNTVPKGLYLYEIRHDDKGWGIRCGLQKVSWSIILAALLQESRFDYYQMDI